MFADPNGNFLIIDITVKERDFIFINAYAPSGGTNHSQNKRKLYFNNLLREIKKFNTDSKIICMGGDFNLTLDDNDRFPDVHRKSCKSKHSFLTLLHTLNLEDIWRVLNPSSRVFSFRSSNGNRSRLDRFYSTSSERQNTSIAYRPIFFTDHYNSAVIKYSVTNVEKGPGLWILNNALLKNKDYAILIENFWNTFRNKKNEFLTLSEWWEKGKEEISALSRKFGKDTKKREYKKEHKYLKMINNATRKVLTKPHLNHLIANLKEKIEQIQANKAKGAAIRSRVKWRLEGEKATRFFFNLEKTQLSQKDMREIKTKTGEILTTRNEVLNEVRSFYDELYSAKDLDTMKQDSMISRTNLVQLSDNQRTACDADLTAMEMKRALFSMANNKSPGSDGISAEFYKTFWSLLQDDLRDVSNEWTAKKRLGNTQANAVITCLHKKGERNDIRNWRPVSLLNVDYKILTKTMANRVTKVLPSIINEQQTACVPGRCMTNNISYTRDAIAMANILKLDACIVSIDQEKAFDSVDRTFLLRSVKHLGFGKNFIRFLKTIYNNITAQIKLNGFLSAPIFPKRGVRQGCPISMILYVLQAEIIASFIRTNKNITGIKVNSRETKLLQYADDTLFFLTGKKSIHELGKSLSFIQECLGTKINEDKSKGLWLGANIEKRIEDRPLGFTWDSKKIKVLGVVLSQDGSEKYEDNWKPAFEKITKSIRVWENLNLSIKGRALIANYILLSKLWYIATTVAPPKEIIIANLERDVNNFLWKQRKTRTTTANTQRNVKDGGLGVISIRLQIKAMQGKWIKKLHNDNSSGPWSDMMIFFLNHYRRTNQGKLVFQTFITETGLRQMPAFYKTLLRTWTDITNNDIKNDTTITDVLAQPIFFNKHISYHGQMLRCCDCPSFSEIIIINDICKSVQPGFLSHKSIGVDERELEKVIFSISKAWREKIATEYTNEDVSQHTYKIPNGDKNWTPIKSFTNKDFYKLLKQKQEKTDE